MAKYYILTGSIRDVISANCPLDAFCKSIKNHKNDKSLQLGELTTFDEKGFTLKNKTLIVSTDSFLKKIGLKFVKRKPKN